MDKSLKRIMDQLKAVAQYYDAAPTVRPLWHTYEKTNGMPITVGCLQDIVKWGYNARSRFLKITIENIRSGWV